MTASKKTMFTLLLLVFIDLVGVGIIIPVLPMLFFSGVFFDHAPMAIRGIFLGIAVAAYPLAQFFGAPIIGALSDRYGRKKLFILSIIGTIIGYILLAISIMYAKLWLLILSRVIDGFTGGNISVVRSAIADISEPRDKAKNFGLIGMAFGLGFILGPFIGGKLADDSIVSWFTYATPFWFAAILSAINLVLIILFFKETLKIPHRRKISWKSGMQDIAKGLARKDLRYIYIASFLILFGWNFFTQFFQVFLYMRFNFNVGQIGNLFAYIGLCIVLTQGFLVRNFIGSMRPYTVLRVATPCLAASFLLLLLPTRTIYLYPINAIIAICFGFIFPTLSTIISDAVSAQEQGEVLGIQQSMFSLAQGIPPLIAGASIIFSSALPMVIGAVCVLGGWAVLLKTKS